MLLPVHSEARGCWSLYFFYDEGTTVNEGTRRSKRASLGRANLIPEPIFTVQDSIPIESVSERLGLVETDGDFSKSYLIGDNNFITAAEEEQAGDFEVWKGLINSFGAGTRVMLSVNNRNINAEEWAGGVLIKETGDAYDSLRKQMNEIIRSRILEGKNGIEKDTYLTVGIATRTAEKAAEMFRRLDRTLDDTLARAQSFARVLSLEERLEVLYGIYNGYDSHLIQRTRSVDPDNGRVTEGVAFDFENMHSQGLCVNDLLAPASMEILRDHIRLGDKFARTMRASGLPSKLKPTFLYEVTDMPFNCLTSLTINPIGTREAEAIIAKNLSFVRDEKTRAIRRGQKAGIYDDTAIDPKIMDREAEALGLRDAMHEQDEHLFETALTVTVFADTREALDEYTDALIDAYKQAGGVVLSPMPNQQEEGFDSTLPLCVDRILEKRTLTTSATAVFIPFSTLELSEPGGVNYSCNAISKNLIVYDRMQADNFNGFILGTPGAGKSFTAKVEMLNVFLKSTADIVVIDPEDEYGPLAQLLGGEVIRIIPGGEVHINPMEAAPAYEIDDEFNPINAKADFILKLMETIVRSPFGLGSVQETIIDECVHCIFTPFIRNGELGRIPEEQMPTLTDLQAVLAGRPEPEARELAMALKLYTGSGSQNAFGFRTNKRTSARFVVYQIRDIGDKMKSLAMLVILDHIWNRIVANRRLGKNTYFYVDEIYLLFQEEYSASFLNTLFRRARKYGGVPTGITQNVSPLLESQTARDMLQNCNFIEILNQAGPDRERLQEILNLSDTQISYITNAPKGQGLLYTGQSVVPFYSKFPKDNDIYRCLTSDMKEIKAYELEARRAKREGNL